MSMIGNFVRVPQPTLTGLFKHPEEITNVIYDDGLFPHLDIDKAWHGIHFLLTGSQWEGPEPLCNVVLGGRSIGEVEVGYGPARGLTVDEVQAVSKALQAIPKEDFAQRFQPADLTANDIYPGIWDEGAEALDYLVENYVQLRKFFQTAAKKNEAVIVYIS
ncbi:MAG: YfbM family protein [Blastocatellia bacterium]|nr:YfbM family protein [Blastocatellia bacterium]